MPDTVGSRMRSAGLQIGRGRLPVLTYFSLVLNLLAFIEIRDAGALQGRNVHEHIRSATVRSNKSEALLAVEPLHCADCHDRILGGHVWRIRASPEAKAGHPNRPIAPPPR